LHDPESSGGGKKGIYTLLPKKKRVWMASRLGGRTKIVYCVKGGERKFLLNEKRRLGGLQEKGVADFPGKCCRLPIPEPKGGGEKCFRTQLEKERRWFQKGGKERSLHPLQSRRK